jgi:hypothetical protein
MKTPSSLRLRSLALAALLLTGCPERPPEAPVCAAEPEVCDGLDNDCDGVADEGIGERVFLDADADGFGDLSTSLLTCTPPEGWVPVPGDCDDTSADVFPGAVERCDGIDQDCDGAIDEGATDTQVFYTDVDGDGFGDDATAREGCTPEPLEITEAGDCDDADASVNPTAPEGVADGIDQNCDALEHCFEDTDFDGSGAPTTTLSADFTCTEPGLSATADDCDDTQPTVNPLSPERCDNGVDDDCDPATPDLFDADNDGLVCSEDCDDTAPPSGTVLYTDVAPNTPLDVPQGTPPYMCGAEMLAGPAAVGDIDGDGDPDIVLPRVYLPDQLFLNNGDGTYTEASAAWGLTYSGPSGGALLFDADGDVDLDLYIVSTGLEGNRFYLNQGSFFEDRSVERGLAHDPPDDICQLSYNASAADIDGDGDLDLHVTAWQPLLATDDSDRDQLFLNDGLGFFTPSDAIDLQGDASYTSSWADFDDDGDPDLAVAADWVRSSLWRNDGGLSFVDITNAASVGTDENGMGSAVGDFDRDGDLDWFVTAIFDASLPCPSGWGCDGNRLFLNDGDLTFTDATDNGVRDGAWSWGTVAFDYDNDGDLDLAAENGFPNAQFDAQFTRLWANDGSAQFTDVACASGLARRGQGRTLVPFDHDADGDLDVLMIHSEAPPRLLEASGIDDRSWLHIALQQPGFTNAHAIGAVVWVIPEVGDAEIRRDIHANGFYGASAPAIGYFGFGAHSGTVARIRILWPDGAEQILTDVATNQFLTVSRSIP